MIVTIDGPAGSGKSTVARRLAERLGFAFLDTGAMYRGVALCLLERKIPWDDADAIGELARSLRMTFEDGRLMVNGRDVTDRLRTPEVTAAASRVAVLAPVREALADLQRQAGSGKRHGDGRPRSGQRCVPWGGVQVFRHGGSRRSGPAAEHKTSKTTATPPILTRCSSKFANATSATPRGKSAPSKPPPTPKSSTPPRSKRTKSFTGWSKSYATSRKNKRSETTCTTRENSYAD